MTALRPHPTLPFLAALCLLVATATHAQTYFLEIDGIEGSSEDEDFTDAIEVLSFNFGGQQAIGSTGEGTFGPLGLPNLTEVNVVSRSDDTITAALFGKLFTGGPIATVTLSGRRGSAGPDGAIALQFELESVYVSTVEIEASDGDQPILFFTLAFEKITISEPEIFQADGTTKKGGSASYDRATNEATVVAPE